MHQVVLNLCANARYAMEDDRGELHLLLKKVERKARQLPLEKDFHLGCFVLLQVVDNGCGIAKENLERVFEPYYTTRDIGSGSGLGLSVIHGIVEDCNGFIEVESEVGKGTTFSVFFPCHGEAGRAETQAAAKEQPTSAENVGKILLVDDEPLILEINSRILEKFGYQFVVTNSSLEALAILTKDPDAFDLLITDQTMPGLTGEDLARQVLKIKPSLPVIICTGHSDIFSEEKALAMGVKKYLYKPILADDLLSVVREVIVDNGGRRNGLA